MNFKDRLSTDCVYRQAVFEGDQRKKRKKQQLVKKETKAILMYEKAVENRPSLTGFSVMPGPVRWILRCTTE